MSTGRIIPDTVQQGGKQATDLVEAFLKAHDMELGDVFEIALLPSVIIIYSYIRDGDGKLVLSAGSPRWSAEELDYRSDYDYSQVDHLLTKAQD